MPAKMLRPPQKPENGNLKPEERSLRRAPGSGFQVAGLRFQVSSVPWIFTAVSAVVLVVQLND